MYMQCIQVSRMTMNCFVTFPTSKSKSRNSFFFLFKVHKMFIFSCTYIHILWTTKTGFLLFLTTVLLLYAMAITRKRRKRVIRNNTKKKNMRPIYVLEKRKTMLYCVWRKKFYVFIKTLYNTTNSLHFSRNRSKFKC